jgi:hypothetical protein
MAGYVWLVMLSVAAVWEAYAIGQKKQTLSQWVWQQDRRFPWFRYVVSGFMVLLLWHFFGHGFLAQR